MITGASAGVGRATARAFAERGDRVALLGPGEAGLDAAAREAGEALPIPVDVADVLRTMKEHQIRRLSVLDGNHQLVGMIAQADVARALNDSDVGELIDVISRD